MAIKSRTATTARTDDKDTAFKQRYAFAIAHDPEMATKMAEAISKDVTLLAGLSHMVSILCKNGDAKAILAKVFERPGIATKYRDAHKAFNTAELNELFSA